MDIMSLKVDEILLLNELVSVAREAKEASEIVKKAYWFGANEKIMLVWSDSSARNCEFLTCDGIWKARYLHQQCDVKCSPDEIFKYFRATYLIEHGYKKERDWNMDLTSYGKQKQIARYFKAFIRRTKKKLSEKEENQKE